MTINSFKTNNIIFNLIILLVLFVPAVMLLRPDGQLIDFPQYYSASKMILSGDGQNIYSPIELPKLETTLFGQGKDLKLYLPPPALPLLAPIALIPIQFANSVWLVLSVLSIYASILILSKVFNIERRKILWLTALVIASGPEWEAIRHGQLASFLLLAFSLSLLALKNNRQFLSGIALAFFSLKPQLILPFVIYLIAARHFKSVLSMTITMLVLSIVSFLILGQSGLQQYSQLMSSALDTNSWLVADVCPTLRGQLLRLFPGNNQLSIIASVAATIFVFALAAYLGHRTREKKLWLEAALSVMPISFLSLSYCHSYDLLILLPAVIAVAQYTLKNRIRRLGTAAVILVGLCFIMPFYILIHYEYVLKGGILNPLFFAFAYLAIFSLELGMHISKQESSRQTSNA